MNNVSRLFSSSFSLKVLCALDCPELERDATFVLNSNYNGKVLQAIFTDILKGVANLCVGVLKNDMNVFLHWRNSEKDNKLHEILNWLEWAISDVLLCISEPNPSYPPDSYNFWFNQWTTLLQSLMQSGQEEVQERAATALTKFVKIDYANYPIDTRTEAILRDNGMHLLLKLAQSRREVLQLQAVKVIATLSENGKVVKAMAEEGGMSILVNLARSVNILVANEAVELLHYLSCEHKDALAAGGAVKVLVDLISKWSSSIRGKWVLENVAGALANLADDDKCSIEVVSVGGVHALLKLTQSCMVESVQEQHCYWSSKRCHSTYNIGSIEC